MEIKKLYAYFGDKDRDIYVAGNPPDYGTTALYVQSIEKICSRGYRIIKYNGEVDIVFPSSYKITYDMEETND